MLSALTAWDRSVVSATKVLLVTELLVQVFKENV
jgi:hypothetical protein